MPVVPVDRPSRRALRAPPRDQERSPFTDILETLVRSVIGGLGSALVDSLGETVDYAGVLSPFDMKVTAAHLQLVVKDEAFVKLGLRRAVVRARSRGYVFVAAPDDYVVVLVTRPAGAFAVTERALGTALRSLAREAGWPGADAVRGPFGPWARIEVREGRSRRPATVLLERAWRDAEILGAIVGLGRFERGYRVRLPATGAELDLVREPTGVWYTDEILD